MFDLVLDTPLEMIGIPYCSGNKHDSTFVLNIFQRLYFQVKLNYQKFIKGNTLFHLHTRLTYMKMRPIIA